MIWDICKWHSAENYNTQMREEWCKWFVAAQESCRTIAKSTTLKQVHNALPHYTHTHPLTDICINIVYIHWHTDIKQQWVSWNVAWIVWVTVVGARETLWFIPSRVMFLVVNIGTSHTPTQWPPTSVSSVRTLNMWTVRKPACLSRTDFLTLDRAHPVVAQTSTSLGHTLYTTVYLRLPEGKCRVKYGRWPWRDPLR